MSAIAFCDLEVTSESLVRDTSLIAIRDLDLGRAEQAFDFHVQVDTAVLKVLLTSASQSKLCARRNVAKQA